MKIKSNLMNTNNIPMIVISAIMLWGFLYFFGYIIGKTISNFGY